MPPATLEAFRDHGETARTVDADAGRCRWRTSRHSPCRHRSAAVTDTLLADGLASFAKSFETLVAGLEAKRAATCDRSDRMSDDVISIPRTGPERSQPAVTENRDACLPAGRRLYPRTKIVCTLGPASNTPDKIRALIQSGLDVARINFSHGTHEQHARVIADIRRVSAELGAPVAILGDLQGPRIRIGVLPAPLELVEGRKLVLAPEEVASGDEVPVTYDMLADDVSPGKRILINDGLIEVAVVAIEPALGALSGAARRHAQQQQGHEPARRARVGAVAHGEGSRRPGVRRGARPRHAWR
jgi:hypothetical protein